MLSEDSYKILCWCCSQRLSSRRQNFKGLGHYILRQLSLVDGVKVQVSVLLLVDRRGHSGHCADPGKAARVMVKVLGSDMFA